MKRVAKGDGQFQSLTWHVFDGWDSPSAPNGFCFATSGDGRNPTPPSMYKTLYINEKPPTGAGFVPSTSKGHALS